MQAPTATTPRTPAADRRWRTCAPFPAPTWELESVECAGHLFAIGGLTNAWGARTGWKPDRLVCEYDPGPDRWTRRSPIPLPLHHMAIAEHAGAIYCFGGYRTPVQGPDDWQPVALAWKYDPAADRWSEIAPLPSARGAAAAATLDGLIYIAGGSHACRRRGEAVPRPCAPHASLAEVLVYDPDTDTYRQAAPMLTARNHHLLECVGGRLLALGGRVGSSNAFTWTNRIDLVEEYDPADDTWWPRARMLAAHGGMMSGVHDGAIYVCGGDNLTMIETLDPVADRWSVAAELPRPRLGATGGCLDARLHVISGHLRTPGGSEPVAEHLALDLA